MTDSTRPSERRAIGDWRAELPLAVGAILLAASALTDHAARSPAAVLAILAAVVVLLGARRRRGAADTRADETRRLATELGASLQRLAASETRYRTMVEHAGDAILTFDLADRITSMNRAAERIFGWQQDALTREPMSRLLSEESVRAIRRWTRANLVTASEPGELEVVGVHREGRILHLELRTVVLWSAGVPTGIEVICRDIGARKELERLRADFLAMIGHDIRNPLSAIFGYTEMILDTFHPLSKEHRELLMRINSNTRTVLTLVGNFLEVSKIESGRAQLERRTVDANAVTLRTADQYTSHAQLTGVTVDVALAADLPGIDADEHQLERIIANLVTNAIKFTPRGGRVRIATERLRSSIALAVSDTGVGIAPHEFSRIFQRYARAGDQSQEGTGLGLYIVGTLVEAHGGFVTIDSTPGSGTTFTVYLPIHDWRESAVAATPPAEAAALMH